MSGGTVVQTCPGGNNNLVSCQVSGTCVPNLTAEQCSAAAGTVVQNCPGGNNNLINCQVAGACVSNAYTVEQCTILGGTQVSSCPGGNNSSSSGGGGSSSSGGKSSSSSAPIQKMYCDYGYPNSEGGGCFPLDFGNIVCDETYGKLSTRCGRTDLQYCRYSTGCYSINSTTELWDCEDYGTFVTECPTSLYGKLYYCYDGDGYGECDKIGGVYWSNAKQCTTSGGAVVDRPFCLEIEAVINN